MKKATADQVKAHYQAQGADVRVDDQGHVEFRKNGGEWLEGRWVSEYRVDERGNVHLI